MPYPALGPFANYLAWPDADQMHGLSQYESGGVKRPFCTHTHAGVTGEFRNARAGQHCPGFLVVWLFFLACRHAPYPDFL